MEAAYAKMGKEPTETMEQRFNAIGNGGYPKDAIYALTGETPLRVSAHDAKQATPEKIFDQLDGALNEGRPVLLSTNFVKTIGQAQFQAMEAQQAQQAQISQQQAPAGPVMVR